MRPYWSQFRALNFSQEIDSEKHVSPRLNETEVMMALSKIKKTASGLDSIPYWVWSDNALLLAPVVTFIWNLSLCSYTWPEAWKESNISPLPKVKKYYLIRNNIILLFIQNNKKRHKKQGLYCIQVL